MNIKTSVLSKIALLKKGMLRVGLFFGGVFVLPLVAFVGTASAYNCPDGALCVYEHANGGGLRTYWGGDWRGTCWNMIPSWNDKISSIDNGMSINGTWLSATFYVESNCSDGWHGNWGHFIVPGGTTATVGIDPFESTFNDRISSVRFNWN
jgi:hypothetical protein